MRRISLTDYTSDEQPFNMRPSLVAVLFSEGKLDPREIIRRDELANHIEQCEEDTLLLEESDWRKLVSGLKATDLAPYGRSVVEFCKRVLDAPQVDIPGARVQSDDDV